MSNPKDVTLDVRNMAPTEGGYKSVKGSDGKIYYFKYTGGDAEHLDGTVTNQRRSTSASAVAFDVSLVCAGCYQIDSITFTHNLNSPHQLTAGASSDNRKRTIHNQNAADLNGRYTVHVKGIGLGPAGADVMIPCDPPIINHQQT
ncbi:MAG: hypothetical protein ABI386_12470 [Rhodanobacter sp.]